MRNNFSLRNAAISSENCAWQPRLYLEDKAREPKQFAAEIANCSRKGYFAKGLYMQQEILNFWKIVERSKSPLICFREDLENSGTPQGGDAIASALVLRDLFQKVEKNPEIVSSGYQAKPHFDFIGANGSIKTSIEALRKFVISLDVSKNKISDFSYEITDEKLNIYLSPKTGLFDEQGLQTKHENCKYDLIIVLDSPSLQSLGKLYTDHVDIFSELPIINIGHDPANEFFGQINLVDATASSTAEVISKILKHQDTQIEPDLATKILAGIIAKTKSFRAPNLSPKTLELASRLIELGARRDEIIQNFYRTRDVETLRLWGRALARLKSSSEHKLVWSVLGREDFLHAGATGDAELADVIHELIVNCPQADVVALIYEQEPLKNCVLLSTPHGRDASEIGKIFGATGSRQLVKFCLTNLNLVETEQEIINKLKQQLK